MDLLTLLRTQWDRAGAWVAIALGALAVVVGWVGVSGTGLTAEQIPYVISGGLGGIFLLGLGAMLWLSADMRDEWRVLEQLREQLEEAQGRHPRDGGTEAGIDEEGDRSAPAIPIAAGSSRRRPLKVSAK